MVDIYEKVTESVIYEDVPSPSWLVGAVIRIEETVQVLTTFVGVKASSVVYLIIGILAFALGVWQFSIAKRRYRSLTEHKDTILASRRRLVSAKKQQRRATANKKET